jgi:hypothetical protein
MTKITRAKSKHSTLFHKDKKLKKRKNTFLKGKTRGKKTKKKTFLSECAEWFHPSWYIRKD